MLLNLRASCFCQLRKTLGIAHGDIGQNLSIQFNASLIQAVYEA
jgi:hypothetical protein